MKDVPPLAQMVSEIKEEVFDDEDDTLDAGELDALDAHFISTHA
jgi:hypothetical protein